MRELKFRVSDETFEKFQAMAKANGLNLTAQFCLMANSGNAADRGITVPYQSPIRGAADSPLLGEQQGNNSPLLAASGGGYIGGGDLGSHQEEKTTDKTEGVQGEPEKPAAKKPKPVLTVASRARFERWYAAYPNKADVGDGEKAWLQHDPGDDAGVDNYIAAIRREEAHRAALKERGEFLPSWKGPGRWLRAKSYLNLYRDAPQSAPVVTVNPHPYGHADWLYVDRSKLGKTSADYLKDSREWVAHQIIEQRIRPEPTPTVSGGW